MRDLGVYWHTRQPFDSVVVLTGAGIAQSDEGGAVAADFRGRATRQCASSRTSSWRSSRSTPRAWRRDFDLFGGVADTKQNRWIIGLKPRAKAIAGVFSEATVTGADDVEQVVLTDARAIAP